MKKIIIIVLSVLCFYSCIKKRAIKYDPDLAGTWVGSNDSVFFWLKVNPEGHGIYRSYERRREDETVTGQVKYSLFELRMWVGTEKFKVKEWLTADMNDVYSLWAKDYETLANVKYEVDRRMVLRTSLLNSRRFITFYRVKQ